MLLLTIAVVASYFVGFAITFVICARKDWLDLATTWYVAIIWPVIVVGEMAERMAQGLYRLARWGKES